MRNTIRHRVPKKERLLQESCPPGIEDRTEQYFLGRLSRVDAARFEEHLLVCSHCVQIALHTMAYLEAAQATPAGGAAIRVN